MVERYFQAANTIMDLANQCTDEEAANILKDGSMKIIELAKSHGIIVKTAKLDHQSE